MSRAMRCFVAESLSSKALIVVAALSGLGPGNAVAIEPGDIIAPGDTRFDTFQLERSTGDGTVLLSFISKDARYCRMARFASDYSVVLACREAAGWKIEASNSLAPGESTAATPFGGGDMREVTHAIEALRGGADLLDGFEVAAATRKGWLDPEPIDADALDARQILEQVFRTYAISESYVDSGHVQTVYTTRLQEWIGETRFETAYVAPGRFRFEAEMRETPGAESGFIAWSDGNDARAWFSLSPQLFESVASLGSALDGGAGVTRDASGMIPGLLIRGTKLGGDIVRLANPVRLEDERIDGFDCFQVQGTRMPHKGPTRVWIDKQSFLIRRVYEEDELKNATTKTTWYYAPTINVPVAEELLRFDR